MSGTNSKKSTVNLMRKRVLTFEEAKREYIGRFTMEWIPEWAEKPMRNRQYHAPQYKTDLEWFTHTKFPGEYPSGNGASCLSLNMSWPLGHSLPAPYSIARGAEETIKEN